MIDKNLVRIFAPHAPDVLSQCSLGRSRIDYFNPARGSNCWAVPRDLDLDAGFKVDVGQHLTLYADAVRTFNSGPYIPLRYCASAVSRQSEVLVEGIQRAEARNRFKKYVHLKGSTQVNERRTFARWLSRTANPGRHIRAFMRTIDEDSSETALQATIDLLSLLGTTIVELAVELAFSARTTLGLPFDQAVSSHRMSSNALYAIAVAAGQVQPTIVHTFRKSPEETFREAAADLAESLAPEAARSVLKSLSDDSSPSVASLARSLLRNVAEC